MAEHSNGGSAELLVLHRAVPAASSADPRARQVARRSRLIQQLSAVPVEVLGLEPPPGSPSTPALGPDPAAALAGRLASARAVWVTDMASARVLLNAFERIGRGVPFVLELE